MGTRSSPTRTATTIPILRRLRHAGSGAGAGAGVSTGMSTLTAPSTVRLEVALEHHGGRDLVDDPTAVLPAHLRVDQAAFRDDGGEALVVHVRPRGLGPATTRSAVDLRRVARVRPARADPRATRASPTTIRSTSASRAAAHDRPVVELGTWPCARAPGGGSRVTPGGSESASPIRRIPGRRPGSGPGPPVSRHRGPRLIRSSLRPRSASSRATATASSTPADVLPAADRRGSASLPVPPPQRPSPPGPAMSAADTPAVDQVLAAPRPRSPAFAPSAPTPARTTTTRSRTRRGSRSRAGAGRRSRARRAAATTTRSTRPGGERRRPPRPPAEPAAASSSSCSAFTCCQQPLDPVGDLGGRDVQRARPARRSCTSSSWMRASAPSPVTASMRRRFDTDRALAHDLDRTDEARARARACRRTARSSARRPRARARCRRTCRRRTRSRRALGLGPWSSRSGAPGRRR